MARRVSRARRQAGVGDPRAWRHSTGREASRALAARADGPCYRSLVDVRRASRALRARDLAATRAGNLGAVRPLHRRDLRLSRRRSWRRGGADRRAGEASRPARGDIREAMIDLPSRTATWLPLPSWQTAIAASALAHRQRWPHALLITSRRRLGKRLLALHFARALLCEAPLENGEACGVCPSCGYVGQGTHPDLQLIEPVTYDEEGNPTPVDTINVERVRELIEFTQLSPHRQRAKVGLIAPAEAMNAAAANALLKTLEEPPAGTFLS